MIRARYDVHGVDLAVETDHAAIGAGIDRRLRHFRPTTAAASAPPLTIVARTGRSSANGAATRSRHGRPVYDSPEGSLLYDETRDTLSLDYGGRAGLSAEPGAGRAELWADRRDDEAVWLLSHPLMTLALAELLKRRGRFPLHAAAMARSGQVLLIAGGSGAGKTTLALALLQAGWAFLSDDTVFLLRGADDVTVLGFADEIDVTEQTEAMFAELLPPTTDGRSHSARAKRQLLVEEAFGAQPAPSGSPAALVLPAVAHRRQSLLTPIEPGEALAALAPNVLLTDPPSSHRHFDVLGSLVASVPCWRLDTGRDFGALADALQTLVECPAHEDAVSRPG